MESKYIRKSRRHFIASVGAASAVAMLGAPMVVRGRTAAKDQNYLTSSDRETDVIWMSAVRQAELIRNGELSCVELTEAHIKRIYAVNGKINAVVQTCFDRAREEAIAADKAVAERRVLGALHGVPMTIKDSIDTEGVISTGGTIGRLNYIPSKDATAVARLRDAGAILLGKTNTPEWTLGGGGIPGVTTTANIIHGLTRNPYDLNRSTAGSSGGAAAIVAAGGATFDIGTDWGGSVRGPSHMTGIAGIKPSFGRVPRTGHIVDYGGIHDTWQQFGPMTRRVEDLNLIMAIISGPDYIDAAIPPMPWAEPANIDTRKLRVAWYTEEGDAEVTPETHEAVKASAEYLASLGCDVKYDYPADVLEELQAVRSKISAERVYGLRRLAKKWGSQSVSPTITAIYDREGATTPELVALLEQQDRTRTRMLQWMKNYDVVLNPIFGRPAGLIDGGLDEEGRTIGGRGANFNGVHNTTGYPAAVVRGGTSSEGLPIGVQVIGQPWRDDVVLAVSAEIEKFSGGWQKPDL